MRDLLNDLPDWALGLIFVGSTVIVVLVAFALVCRFLSAWRAERSSETIGGVAAMVMTLFAVVLAFVVVNLYSSYVGAVDNAAAEATSLTELVQDARAFPSSAQVAIDRAVGRYVAEVRDEFRALRTGHADPLAQLRLGDVFHALQSYSPATVTAQQFYSSAIGQLHTVVRERASRLDAAETSIPEPLVVFMILLAGLTLALSVLIQTHFPRVDVAIVTTIATVVSAGLLTAVLLEYPFSGSIAVTTKPFDSGTLAHLAPLHP